MSGFASLCTDRKTNQSLENTRKARCTNVQRVFSVVENVLRFDRKTLRGVHRLFRGVQMSKGVQNER